ncbi:MAG: esterase-like activity of phytase family protein [Isosphaeraceae bacterium]
MRQKPTKTARFFCLLALGILLAAAQPAAAQGISGLNYLGQAVIPPYTIPAGPAGSVLGVPTWVGGLSGLAYDPSTGKFLAISDDRSQIGPARYYTLDINLTGNTLDASRVSFTGVTVLRDAAGATFAPLAIDAEGIARTADGRVFIASEGDRSLGIQPFVNQFDAATGQQVSALPVPSKFLVGNPNSGVNNNRSFESLTITPSEKFLYTANEIALVQDGPDATATNGSPSRILQFDLATGLAAKEFLYNVDPIAIPQIGPGPTFTSLAELIALDDGHLLALERSLTSSALDAPFTIKLFEVSLDGATDISGIQSLKESGLDGIVAARKTLLMDLSSLNIPLDNVEGMALGPTLANGNRSLILVSDDNFFPNQSTQFIAFEVLSVPEPSSIVMLGLGSLVVAAARRRGALGRLLGVTN